MSHNAAQGLPVLALAVGIGAIGLIGIGLMMAHLLREMIRAAAPLSRRGTVAERMVAADLKAAAEWESAERTAPEYCSYPECNCPFDAPGGTGWCLRKLPHRGTRDAVQMALNLQAVCQANGGSENASKF